MFRNVFSFFEILFWPVVGIISIGLMGNFLELRKEVLSFLLTGVIVSGVLQVSQLEVSYGLLYEIWSKSVKQIFFAPIKHLDYIIGSWIAGVFRGIIVFVMLTFLSIWWFKFYLPSISITIIFISGIFLFALIIGLIVIFFLLLFGQRIDIIAWSVSVLSMLICGIYYPVTYLPKWLQYIASVIPLTYFLEYFRAHYGFELTFSNPLMKGFMLTFVYVAILIFLIHLAYERARRSGMIVRLSE